MDCGGQLLWCFGKRTFETRALCVFERARKGIVRNYVKRQSCETLGHVDYVPRSLVFFFDAIAKSLDFFRNIARDSCDLLFGEELTGSGSSNAMTD